MPALYTITTRASGTILTAAIYNADHQNHVNNGDAQHLGGFSANTSQMRTQTSPGDVGSESLSLSIADELARIRYMIALQRGTTFWYGSSQAGGAGWAANYLRNSNFLTAQRMGQASQVYAASAASPYTFDCWYIANGPSQALSVIFGNPLYSNDINSAGISRTPGQTGTNSMYLAQPFTLAQLAPLRGQQVTASITFGTGAGWSAPSITLQLLWGTGTACKSTAGFTVPTSAAVIAQPTSPNMGATRIQATGILPTNATQMELRMLWAPVGTAIAADTIVFAQAKLELGSQATPYIPPDPYDELQELSAFYFKTFGLGVLPQGNAGNSGSFSMSQSGGASTVNGGYNLRWPSRMIKPPTVSLYNPAAVNQQARSVNLALDCTVTSCSIIDESSGLITFTSPAGSAAGQPILVHATADAGL